MLHFIAGHDVSLSLPFKVGGEFVVPDVGSAKYTLRDQAGNPVEGQIDFPITTDESTTSASITLPASVNEIGSDDLQKRSVEYSWKVGGQAYRAVVHYLLTAWLNFTTEPQDVRAYIGCDFTELPDEDIDLARAYLDICDKVTKSVFDAELARADNRGLKASRAVCLKAVLNVIPSLQLRVAVMQRSDANQFRRLSRLDLEELGRQADAELSQILSTMTSEPSSSIAYVSVTTPPDPVTGEE